MSIATEYRDKSSPPSSLKDRATTCPSKPAQKRAKWGMAKSATDSEYQAVIRLRTRRAREAIDKTQAEMAAMIGIELANYKKNESRSVLQPQHMWRFCSVTGTDLEDFLSPPSPSELAFVRSSERQSA